MRALLVSPEAPFPAIGGGALRTASLIEFLGTRYELDVIVFGQPEHPNPAADFPAGLARRVISIPLRHNSRTLPAKIWRNGWRFLQGTPPLVDRFSGYEREIMQALSGQQYALAVLEHEWIAPLLPVVKPHARKTILNLHNIESNLFHTYAASDNWPTSVAHERWANSSRRIEERFFPQFDSVLTCSEEDARTVRPMVKQVSVYPNALPLVDLPEVPKEADLVFSGNLEYPPNKTAVAWFTAEIWPLLKQARPEISLRIVGLHPNAVRPLVCGQARIHLVGTVQHAIPAIAASSIAIVPLLSGSGTRIKILEAWAAGVPVVSTSLGAQGLLAADAKHLLIADTPRQFKDAVVNLLENPQRAAQLAQAGRVLYELEYTWPAVWKKLDLTAVSL